MNLEIILSVFVGMFLYNIVIKAIGATLIKYFLDNSKTAQEQKKSFQDRINEKLNNK
jgi:hypothetical protein